MNESKIKIAAYWTIGIIAGCVVGYFVALHLMGQL